MIVDESFIHFADRPTPDNELPTLTGITKKFDNVTVVKSMSKDFGIAGIRAGYAIMQPERVTQLLDHGYLWNTSGLAEYFFGLFGRSKFLGEYRGELARYKGYINKFTSDTSNINYARVFETDANFQLMQMPGGVSAEIVAALLLIRHAVYVRSCGDKIGLNGEFIRVAIGTESEHVRILDALVDILS